jgi:hypothetical protein
MSRRGCSLPANVSGFDPHRASITSRFGQVDDGEDTGMTQLGNLHFWLDSIHAQAPRAPIIVVGTKADTVDEAQKQRRIAQVPSPEHNYHDQNSG